VEFDTSGVLQSVLFAVADASAAAEHLLLEVVLTHCGSAQRKIRKNRRL